MSNSTNILYALGRPFSPLYGALMRLRASLYQRNILRRHAMPVPVISVGNLTMGGTGKTPIVASLAAFLQKQGFKPAIISRGYGGAANNRVNVVSDGRQLLMSASQAGDEPRLLAESLLSIPVLTGIVRVLPCRHAIEKMGCDILLLDDGFQHLAVERNINLALFNAETLAGNSRVFPGGDLREPVSALNRADAFLLTGVDEGNQERSSRFGQLLQQRFPDRPIFFCSYSPQCARNHFDNNPLPLSDLPTPLYGFCGIAHPDAFRKSLNDLKLSLTGFTGLRDHQPYTAQLLRQIEKKAVMSGAKALITTAKDRVKLQELPFSLPLFRLEMSAGVPDDLHRFIMKKLHRQTREHTR